MPILRRSVEAFISDNYIVDEIPAGTLNGVNLEYTTAFDYDPATLTVYLNGQALHSGSGNDYVMSEGAGPGTGYDTITLERAAAKSYEVITVSYFKA
jgi:hypothetical protein